MQRECFIIKYTTANNCFAYLSDSWLRKLGTKENVIELEFDENKYYLSCLPKAYCDNTINLGATFARSLNISEGDRVFVSSVKSIHSLKSITVVPKTKQDREILELQVNKVQSTLLNQIRIVAKGQPVLAWISKFSYVTFVTESLEPDFSYGKLEQFTEVHVSNDVEDTKKSDVSNIQKNVALLSNIFNKCLPTQFNKENKKTDNNEVGKSQTLLQSFRKKIQPRVYRVHILPRINSYENSNLFDIRLQCPYHVFLSRKHLPENVVLNNGAAFCKIRKVPEDKQYVNASTSTNFLRSLESSFPKLSEEIVVRAFLLEDTLENCSNFIDKNYFDLNSNHGVVYVPESVRVTLNVKTGGRIVLREFNNVENAMNSSLEIFPWKESVSVETIREYLRERAKYDELLLNTSAALFLNNDNCCTVKITPNSTSTIINKNNIDKINVDFKLIQKANDLPVLDVNEQESCLEKISLRHVTNILSECHLTFDLSLNLRREQGFHYDRENILICGDIGSGKTTFCKMLINDLIKPPHFIHTHYIECRSIKGKKVETMQKLIQAAMYECVYYQPSVLFLDDLESITSVSSNDEENTPDAVNASRICDMLMNIVTQYQKSHYVSVVATCAGMNKIGQKLRPARGNHFFRSVFSMANLEKTDRIDILRMMLSGKLHVPGDVNWDYYGNKTEGWVVQDLVDMAEKARFDAWKRSISGGLKPPIIIIEEDLLNALKRCTPISLHDVNLYKNTDFHWSDIGGLNNVKRSLTEILHWPLKYPEMFKKAPIKLQNGVLLYGMPGTGKTMLAKAIANECGVNLISVKGPELLSKYIGVSEESVRNIFERALRARPCVLFFDEFDSLAPRRGHDSTGVTDRVVNQLLTQLDGVEDREGVAVVAASSRPDLLDPALLRPGRLDKALHCPLPRHTDRQEILAAICRSQKLDTTELNLVELSDLSEEFTGADLNAAVTQARLSAFEDAIKSTPDGKVEPSDIKVTQKHLVDSIMSTHPSLSVSEKKKYFKIYARFSKGDNFAEDIMKNQKATLA